MILLLFLCEKYVLQSYVFHSCLAWGEIVRRREGQRGST